MNTHPGLKPTSSPKLSVSGRIILVVGASLLILALIAIIQSRQSGLLYESLAVFYFSPDYDNQFDNPKNWTPSFPGLTVGKDSSVVVQGLAHMEKDDLKILGTLRIAMGANLYAPEARITLDGKGSLFNAGELIVQEFDNHGTFINEIRATAHTQRFEAFGEAHTENKKKGRITVTELLNNKGHFLNEGITQVREDFNNQATFEQVNGGQLLVQGKVVSVFP